MITEKEFSQTVVELALRFGWKVYRTWNSQHSPAGYPDLTMVREDILLFAELKSEKGKVTPAQWDWLLTLAKSGKCEAHLWKPEHWDEIVETLR